MRDIEAARRYRRLSLPAIVVAGSLILAGCGGQKPKSVKRATTETPPVTVSDNQVKAEAVKFVDMIDHIRRSTPQVPQTIDKDCKPRLHGFTHPGKPAVETYTSIEARNGKGGYDFSVTEIQDKRGQTVDTSVVEVDISRAVFRNCADYGETESIILELSNKALIGSSSSLDASSYNDSNGLGQDTTFYITPQSHQEALTPQVFAVYSKEAESILNAAAKQTDVTSVTLPSVRGPASQ